MNFNSFDSKCSRGCNHRAWCAKWVCNTYPSKQVAVYTLLRTGVSEDTKGRAMVICAHLADFFAQGCHFRVKVPVPSPLCGWWPSLHLITDQKGCLGLFGMCCLIQKIWRGIAILSFTIFPWCRLTWGTDNFPSGDRQCRYMQNLPCGSCCPPLPLAIYSRTLLEQGRLNECTVSWVPLRWNILNPLMLAAKNFFLLLNQDSFNLNEMAN